MSLISHRFQQQCPESDMLCSLVFIQHSVAAGRGGRAGVNSAEELSFSAAFLMIKTLRGPTPQWRHDHRGPSEKTGFCEMALRGWCRSQRNTGLHVSKKLGSRISQAAVRSLVMERSFWPLKGHSSQSNALNDLWKRRGQSVVIDFFEKKKSSF